MLRHQVGWQGPSVTSGEVELESVSDVPIAIEVSMHPLQYLDLIVTDAKGSQVPTRPYGNIFSPRGETYTFRLAPGEKYIHNVSLLGNLPQEDERPGTYVVRAIYEYQGLRAVSEPLTVTLLEKH
jgi:hypothetical protein